MSLGEADLDEFIRKRKAERKALYRERARLTRKSIVLSDAQKAKGNARAYANVYLRRGKIELKPCAACGSEDAEMHHEDYSRPLAVTWLCRACHLALHKAIRLYA